MPVMLSKAEEEAYLAKIIALAKVRKIKTAKGAYNPLLGDTPEEARVRQDELKGDLGAYGEFVFGNTPARHHRIWIELVKALLNNDLPGGKRKLLILAPPGTAKSVWLSLTLAPFYLGMHPDENILFFTASDDNAKNFSGTIRDVLDLSEQHKAVFNDSACRPDKRRGWSTDGYTLKGLPLGVKDPSLRVVGFGSKVIGARSDLTIMDDPLDQQSSQSDVEVVKAIQYYDMTITARLRPGGHEVAVMTRWGSDDFAAYLISRGDFFVIRCPMEAELLSDDAEELPDPTLQALGGFRVVGDLLWPEYFTPEYVAELKTGGTANFSCVYQCDPAGLGGDIFANEDWFLPLPSDLYEKRDDGKSFFDRLTKIVGVDLAYSHRDTSALTAIGLFGVDQKLNMYLLDVINDRLSEQGVVDAVVGIIARNKASILVVEDAAYRTSASQDIIRRVLNKVMVRGKLVKPSGDKVDRARLAAGRAEAGKFFVDRKAKWYPAFRDQCLAFPRTKYKDMVDMWSITVQALVEFAADKELGSRPIQAVISPAGRAPTKKLRKRFIVFG